MSELKAYRLIKSKWKASAFDGEGAKRFGGRWNSKGQSCVYLANSLSLALLEIMVHINHYALLKHYVAYELHFDASDVLSLGAQNLPKNWQEEPAPPETAMIGDQWLEDCASLLLAVPSVIIPQEKNYLLNVNHPHVDRVLTSVVEVPFQADERLLK